MPTADNDTLLIFRIAGVPCAVPAQSVDTIVMPPAHLTHPPGTGKSTPGIFQHSDQVHAVIDLHERFGIDTPRKGPGRLLLNHEGMRHYAFWVDEVVGLVRSEQGKWAALPPYLPRTLFWSGFLYREEIVLCTRLDDLRRMRDAAPLHLHLAALQPKPEQEQEQTKEKTDTKREVNKENPAPRMRQAAEPFSPPLPAVTKEPSAPKAAPIPVRTVRPAPPRPATETRAHSTKPLPSTISRSAARSASYSAAKPRSAMTATKAVERKTSAPKDIPPVTRAVKPAPPLPTGPLASSQPPSSTESRSLLPWLLFLFVLGVGGYFLWPDTMPDTEAMVRPIPLQQEPSTSITSTSFEQAAEKPAAPPPEAIDSSPPMSATPEARAEEVAVPQSEDRPLRIERDDEGTINLIIDRAAIKAQASTQPSAPRHEGAPSVEETAATTLPTAPAPAESAMATAGAEAEEEKPLQPEPDWPAPIPATVEPCDCTHIVVKGAKKTRSCRA